MNNDKKYDLLLDIIKLLKKYGHETFFDLHEELSSHLLREKLAEMVFQTAKTAREVGFNRHPKKKISGTSRSFRSQLSKLSETQPDKSKILIKLYDDMLDKKCLPTLRDINNFIQDNGLSPLNAKSRKNAIIPFMRQFLDFDYSDIEKRIKNIPSMAETGDRSLAGWTNIILKKSAEDHKE